MGQNRTNHAKSIRVVALTGGVTAPASYFRVRQYIPRLAEQGVYVHEHIPFFHYNCGLPSFFKAIAHIPGVLASRNADVVWTSRELVQGYETFEGFLKRPRVMDVDDAIWLSRPLGKYTVPHIARGMDGIVAGNKYLADWFSRYCKKVYVLPTAIDLGRYHKRPDSAIGERNKFVIGWTGLACNYKYLKLIEQPLKRFLQDHPDAELHLVAQRTWKSREIAPERVRFTAWSREIEASVLQEMSVGIMPLSDDKWTRGKCSFKMLQYMAVGLPVVVSPVGMNKEVLEKDNVGFGATSDDEWYDCLKTLYEDRTLQLKLGNAARRVVEQDFSAAVIADRLAHILKKAAVS